MRETGNEQLHLTIEASVWKVSFTGQRIVYLVPAATCFPAFIFCWLIPYHDTFLQRPVE
jgi:hypothetical protein